MTSLPTSVQDITSLSANARQVLKSRYLKQNDKGVLVETPRQMFRRVAKAIAAAELKWSSVEKAEKWEAIFFEMMTEFRFLPNSPTLMNAGLTEGQLSACFVLPVENHLEDIFETLKLTALVHQSGGGTGFNFSRLLPKNSPLTRRQGIASGPVSFMNIFNVATEHVKQGGKRRGANMGILNVDHPDIVEFVESKRREGELKNFNISVGVTDSFMLAAGKNEKWPLIHPVTGEVTDTVSAGGLWDHIISSAWESGDPGLIFIDHVNTQNPTPLLGSINATNPCGEVPLLPYESCNLGSVNLSRFISYTAGEAALDWHSLHQTVAAAVRFLDNVIEVNHYIVPEIKEITEGNRKIGLGVMGWAELLSLLEIPYASVEAIRLGEQIMAFISEKSLETSLQLAKERGPFKNWQKSTYYPQLRLRNATRTSIAPTGTISIIADTSASIEPFFALAYQRKHVLKNETLQEVNKSLLRYLSVHQLNTADVIAEVLRTGTLTNASGVPAEVKRLFETALEIAPEWHLKHQAAFQKFTDNAVSKTINLPEGATPADIDWIYRQAWQQKLKGITVFRNNSRKSQVLHRGVGGEASACKVCVE